MKYYEGADGFICLVFLHSFKLVCDLVRLHAAVDLTVPIILSSSPKRSLFFPKGGFTSLMYAAMYGRRDSLTKLAASGASKDLQEVIVRPAHLFF
jgi:hypothetical protein